MPRGRGRLRVLVPPRRIPAHPYRDSAIVYGGLAVAIVAIAALTGGSTTKAVYVAITFFVIAFSFSWIRWRRQLQEEARRKAVEDRMRST